MNNTTRRVGSRADGNHSAEELLAIVYGELRRLAAHKITQEAHERTLQPTALVHEAWLKLANTSQVWNSRGHFFTAAAEAMRRILIDRARKRKRLRHGEGLQRVDLNSIDIAATADDGTLLHVNEALNRLSAESPEKAELVMLRYFAGLSIPEAAEALGISEATAKRHWSYARAWLFAELNRMS